MRHLHTLPTHSLPMYIPNCVWKRLSHVWLHCKTLYIYIGQGWPNIQASVAALDVREWRNTRNESASPVFGPRFEFEASKIVITRPQCSLTCRFEPAFLRTVFKILDERVSSRSTGQGPSPGSCREI
jgi:hypothetical protein